MSTLKTEKFVRKPFPIDAVQVTEENMEAVAKWCGGEVLTEARGNRTVKYIQVPVARAINERQKKAHVGDWVLSSETRNRNRSFKCYTPKAFDDCFERPEEDATALHFSGQSPLPLEELADKYAPGKV
jgi:hypothetical protein